MRLQNWPERLTAYLDVMRDKPFAWGVNDCATFAAGAVESITGLRPIMPVYSDAMQAGRLADSQSMRGRLVERFGEPVHPARAQRGDLVLFDVGRPTLGVVTDAGIAAVGPSGMLIVPMRAAMEAWRVV